MTDIQTQYPLLEKLLLRFEGVRNHAYFCPAGILTIGVGHCGPGFTPDTVWTTDQCIAVMRQDIKKFVRGTLELCPDLTGDKLCAIADFAYNLGLGRLRASTLRRRVNEEDWAGAAAELAKWVNGGGRKLPGLVKRRAVEAAILLG